MSGQHNSALVPAAAPRAAAVRLTFLQRAQDDYAFFQREVSGIQTVVDVVDAAEVISLRLLMMEPGSSKSSILPRERVHMVALLGTQIRAAQASDGYDDELYVTYQAIGKMTQSWLFSDSLKERIHRTLSDLRAGRLERRSRYPLLASLHQQNLELQAEVKRVVGELTAKMEEETKMAAELEMIKAGYDAEVEAKLGLEQQNAELQAALVTKDQELKQALALREKDGQAHLVLQQQNAALQQSLEAKNKELEDAKIRHAQELAAQAEIIAKKDKQIDQLTAQLDKAITRLDQTEESLKQLMGFLGQKEQQKERPSSPRFF